MEIRENIEYYKHNIKGDSSIISEDSSVNYKSGSENLTHKALDGHKNSTGNQIWVVAWLRLAGSSQVFTMVLNKRKNMKI